jgi:glycosyltransferase involved in cell wall biosynthesis
MLRSRQFLQLIPSICKGNNMRKMRNRPRVSVIVPTFNSERTLLACLGSVCNQSYSFREIIVVDNFSHDDTLKIARQFGAKIIQKKCNPALARNLGVTNSHGEFVLFLDSDQILSKGLIDECVHLCTAENAGMVWIPEVFSGHDFWGSCSAVWKNSYERVDRLYGSSKDLIHGEPRFFCKEKLICVGMLDTALLWGENYFLFRKLKSAGVKEAFCRSEIYHDDFESLKEILIKNLRYGKSIPTFLERTQEQVLLPVLRHTILAFGETLRSVKKSPDIAIGCFFILWLKACTAAAGFVAGKNYSFLRKKSQTRKIAEKPSQEQY